MCDMIFVNFFFLIQLAITEAFHQSYMHINILSVSMNYAAVVQVFSFFSKQKKHTQQNMQFNFKKMKLHEKQFVSKRY